MKKNGFSLIEALVVMSIMGILTVGSFSLIANMMKSSSYNEDRLSKVLFNQSVQSVMADFAACQNTYLGIRPGAVGSTQTLTDIKSPSGGVVYSSGSTNNNFENLIIKKIDLIKRDITPGAAAGRVSLIFHLTRDRSGGGPGNFVTDPIDTRVLMNTGTNQIAGCSSGGVAGSSTQVLKFFDPGPNTVSGFSETEVMSFSLDRLPAPSEIIISAHVGGTDIVWAHFRLYRGSRKIAQWTDGTAHKLGAAIRTNYIKYMTDTSSGPQNYRLTVERLSHPSYGSAPMHMGAIDIIFKQ